MRCLLAVYLSCLQLVPAVVSLQLPPTGTTASTTRRKFLWGTGAAAAAVATTTSTVGGVPTCAQAFDGGVGGLGKTKPETGVTLWEGSAPIQNQKGIVSAELVSFNGNPLLVEFQTPWPLLATTSGLEARDLQQPESAFVQVIHPSSSSNSQSNPKALIQLFIEEILGSKGKYGTHNDDYGQSKRFSPFFFVGRCLWYSGRHQDQAGTRIRPLCGYLYRLHSRHARIGAKNLVESQVVGWR